MNTTDAKLKKQFRAIVKTAFPNYTGRKIYSKIQDAPQIAKGEIMNSARQIKNFENSMLKLGSELSKPFHKRIHQIIKLLHPTFQIFGLTMNMGGWYFDLDSFDMSNDADEKWKGDWQDFNDFLRNPYEKHQWPSEITEKQRQIAEELQEILQFLTEEPYAQVLEFQIEFPKKQARFSDRVTRKEN